MTESESRRRRFAQHILASMGERVSLTSEQHKGNPTDCFGETEYFVTAVRVIE